MVSAAKELGIESQPLTAAPPDAHRRFKALGRMLIPPMIHPGPRSRSGNRGVGAARRQRAGPTLRGSQKPRSQRNQFLGRMGCYESARHRPTRHPSNAKKCLFPALRVSEYFNRSARCNITRNQASAAGTTAQDGAARGGSPMALLELKRISKHFGAIEALAAVDFDMEPGLVVGLMGDNGAGKSTLVKVIAGNFPPSTGEILLEGRPVHFHRPVDARAAGIEVVYQDLALCNNLSASANVFLGREKMRRFGPIRVLDDKAMHVRARELFGELKSETRPADAVRMMSGGQRQAVAIARTHLSRAKIVLMDEP